MSEKEKPKNPAAVALGKLRAQKGPDLRETGALGGRPSKRRKCPKCGVILPSAREAWKHCLKGGPGYEAWQAKKLAAKKKK